MANIRKMIIQKRRPRFGKRFEKSNTVKHEDTSNDPNLSESTESSIKKILEFVPKDELKGWAEQD